MREALCLHIGQGGVQIGYACWELFNCLATKGVDYFVGEEALWNICDWIIIGAVGVSYNFMAAAHKQQSNDLRSIAMTICSFGSILVWLRSVYFAVGFREWGQFVHVVFFIFGDCGYFFSMLIVILCGFSQGFYIFFHRDPGEDDAQGFETPFTTFVTAFLMMMGDYPTDDLMASWITVLYFLVFGCLISITLLNVLIAKMNDSYATTMTRAQAKYSLTLATQIASVESTWTWLVKRKYRHCYKTWLYSVQRLDSLNGDEETQQSIRIIDEHCDKILVSIENRLVQLTRSAQSVLENATAAQMGNQNTNKELIDYLDRGSNTMNQELLRNVMGEVMEQGINEIRNHLNDASNRARGPAGSAPYGTTPAPEAAFMDAAQRRKTGSYKDLGSSRQAAMPAKARPSMPGKKGQHLHHHHHHSEPPAKAASRAAASTWSPGDAWRPEGISPPPAFQRQLDAITDVEPVISPLTPSNLKALAGGARVSFLADDGVSSASSVSSNFTGNVTDATHGTHQEQGADVLAELPLLEDLDTIPNQSGNAGNQSEFRVSPQSGPTMLTQSGSTMSRGRQPLREPEPPEPFWNQDSLFEPDPLVEPGTDGRSQPSQSALDLGTPGTPGQAMRRALMPGPSPADSGLGPSMERDMSRHARIQSSPRGPSSSGSILNPISGPDFTEAHFLEPSAEQEQSDISTLIVLDESGAANPKRIVKRKVNKARWKNRPGPQS